MPTRTESVDPEVFLEHNGVTIYHIYKNDDIDASAREFWFTVDPDQGSDDNGHGTGGTFDVRQLPIPKAGPSLRDQPPFLGYEEGERLGFKTYDDWVKSPEYEDLQRLWDTWHSSGRIDAIKNIIRNAIDIGVLTKDEVKLEEVTAEELITLQVTVTEHDTILAALRFWQRLAFDSVTEMRHDFAEYNIATNGESHELLSLDEIDSLCERINTR
jgi:hypothetical protein